VSARVNKGMRWFKGVFWFVLIFFGVKALVAFGQPNSGNKLALAVLGFVGGTILFGGVAFFLGWLTGKEDVPVSSGLNPASSPAEIPPEVRATTSQSSPNPASLANVIPTSAISALKTNEQTNASELPAISNPAITIDLAQSARTQEQLWADALTEFESASRRPGLWAKSFAEASGNDAMAKANYLRFRVEELELEAKSQSDEARRKKTTPATAIAASSNVTPVNMDAIAEVQISFVEKYAWVFALLVASSVVIFFALNKANPTTKPVAGVGALAVADSSAVATQQKSDEMDALDASKQPFDATVGPNGGLVINQLPKPKAINLATDFDWAGAYKAGATNDQILSVLSQRGLLDFDYAKVKKQGVSDDQIADYFNPPKKVDVPPVADGKPVSTPKPKLASPDVKTSQKLNERALTKGDNIRVTPQQTKIDPEILKQEVEAQKLQAQVAQTARDAQAISDAQMMVKFEFPKWMEDVKSFKFKTWIENEPLEIQALMNSKSVEDTRSLMKRYYGRNKK